jgi:hypothetical protein
VIVCWIAVEVANNGAVFRLRPIERFTNKPVNTGGLRTVPKAERNAAISLWRDVRPKHLACARSAPGY